MSEKIYGQFDLETIEKLADIVNDKALSEITLTDGDKTITVKGKRFMPPQPPMGQMMPPIMPPMGMPAGAPAAAPVNAPAPVNTVSGTQVKAPIVGTFYAASSPDSKPFVSVGDKVRKGDVIFIIESMKVMSEVTSEYDGIVKEICVKNGDAVEFDQTIMILE